MSQTKTFLIMCGTIGTALILLISIFILQFHIRKIKDETAKDNAFLTAERNQNKILKAEWSFLTQIENLRKLSNEHLTRYKTISTNKVKTIEELRNNETE